MPFSGMMSRLALVRTDVSEERIESVIIHHPDDEGDTFLRNVGS
jgi:hypothetical protein